MAFIDYTLASEFYMRMGQRLPKIGFLFAIILFVSLLSTAILIGFDFLSELTLQRSGDKRSSKHLQDYHAAAKVADKVTSGSVYILHVNRNAGFNSPQYSNLSMKTSAFQVHSASSSPKASELGRRRSTSQADLRKRSQEYCNSLEHSSYIEGSIPNLYKLSAVAIVIRHGERTPLYRFLNHTLSKKISCNFSDIIGNQSFRLDYLFRSNDKNEGGKPKINVPLQNLYPSSHACGIGQLTSQGFLQMVQLGKHFRNAYFNGKDFSQSVLNTSSQIYVRTTRYSRTVQSVHGLLLGLLQNKDFEKVRFIFDEDIYFCSNSMSKVSCNCPAVDGLARIIKQEYQQISDITRSKEKLIKSKLSAIFQVSAGKIPWIGAVLEVFMSRVCLGLNPPCRLKSSVKSHCVTWSMINKMWDYSDNYHKLNLNSSADESFSILASYPLLHDIVHHFLNVTNYSTHTNSTRLFIFSGHDKTLMAIMKALRIHTGHWPPFASQVTFELYSQRNKQYYIRVLYNGKDLTKQVKFCRNLGNSSQKYCPFENFMYFILYEVYRQFKVKNYSEMCQQI